jgi:hypothetical protein
MDGDGIGGYLLEYLDEYRGYLPMCNLRNRYLRYLSRVVEEYLRYMPIGSWMNIGDIWLCVVG